MATPTTASTPAQLQAELQAILNGPAVAPPAGVTPNFYSPANLDRFVILTLTLCITLSTFAVLTRLYTKKFLIRSWAYEDCETIISSLPKSTALLNLTRCSCDRMGKPTEGSLISLADVCSSAKSHRAFHGALQLVMVRECTCGMYR